MTDARAMLDRLRTELAAEQAGQPAAPAGQPAELAGAIGQARPAVGHGGVNRLVPMIGNGTAPVSVLAELGAEEHLIVASDRRSFLTLAARADQPDAIAFFTGLGQGESLALAQLPAFTTAAGMTPQALAHYQPRAGCQAYPSYLAWLALNAEPCDVALAVLVNFAAWGEYCAVVGQALRAHYGFPDDACAFFDFFAAPVPELAAQGLAVVGAGASLDRGRRYARLLQSYEMSFWNTLADAAAPADVAPPTAAEPDAGEPDALS